MNSSPRRRQPFTLIEILMVCGIVAALMFIALPGFKKLTTGGALQVAARQLSAKLKLAREAAIAENTYIGVAIPIAGWPAQSTYDGNADIPDKYFHQSYRVFRAYNMTEGRVSQSVTIPGTGTTTVSGPAFMGWYPGENWEFLPKGAIIAGLDRDKQPDDNLTVDYVSGDSTATSTNKNSLNWDSVVWLADAAGSWSGAANHTVGDITGLASGNHLSMHFAAVVFGPDGRLVSGSVERYINLREGRFIASAGNVRSGSSLSGGDTPGGQLIFEESKKDVGVNLIIEKYTGQIKIEEVF